jgi:hypothetical protein
MKALPSFIEHPSLREILTLERDINDTIPSGETQQNLYSQNRRRLIQELRHERELLKIASGYKS